MFDLQTKEATAPTRESMEGATFPWQVWQNGRNQHEEASFKLSKALSKTFKSIICIDRRFALISQLQYPAA